MSLLSQVLVFLAAAVVAVPLARRAGMGSVLGYLAAGVVIGPAGVGLIRDAENVLPLAEFGVVLLLFLIGLDLHPSRMWELRRTVFGLGGLQVGVTGVLLALAALAFGLPPRAAVIAGFALSLSSTALGVQLLAERNELTSAAGRASFGILLLQDLAVVPLLVLVPVLSGQDTDPGDPLWLDLLEAVAVLGAVVFGGRFLLQRLFGLVARANSRDAMTASALLVVVGISLLVAQTGLSMALGAFLAGVLLAESEYRHELQADIEPFKGLLLGLFFIAVGMSLELGLVLARPLTVLALVVGLILFKGALLFAIGRWSLGSTVGALAMAVMISQGGEFAFVLFTFSTAAGLLEHEAASLLTLVVSLSMIATPLLLFLFDRLVRPGLKERGARAYDVSPEGEPPVIIAGFGRVGQVVGRVLRARRIPFTAMDASPEHVDLVKKFGSRVFYGDSSRLDLLRAAKADKAQVFVLAIEDEAASLRTAAAVRQHFPHLTIFARAHNRVHAYRLLELGVTQIIRETFASSLELTEGVLQALGLTYSEAHRTVERYREHDEKLLLTAFQYAADEQKLTELAHKARRELEELLDRDTSERGRE